MPQSRTSHTFKQPNGQRITVTTGKGRRRAYKTVTVRSPNGTSQSRTYHRSWPGAYDNSLPRWARPPVDKATRRANRPARVFALLITAAICGWVLYELITKVGLHAH